MKKYTPWFSKIFQCDESSYTVDLILTLLTSKTVKLYTEHLEETQVSGSKAKFLQFYFSALKTFIMVI